jgi:hypothetical protein
LNDDCTDFADHADRADRADRSVWRKILCWLRKDREKGFGARLARSSRRARPNGYPAAPGWNERMQTRPARPAGGLTTPVTTAHILRPSDADRERLHIRGRSPDITPP